jgi:hypothetical protein
MKMPCMVQVFICIGLDFWGQKIIIISKQRRLQITQVGVVSGSQLSKIIEMIFFG